jgi:hypothetical protein
MRFKLGIRLIEVMASITIRLSTSDRTAINVFQSEKNTREIMLDRIRFFLNRVRERLMISNPFKIVVISSFLAIWSRVMLSVSFLAD